MYGIDQLIDKKKKLFHGLPQEEMQRRAKVSGGLLDALATEKVLAEKAAAKNSLNMAMQGSQKTIVQENEDNLLGRTQQETAEGVAGVLNNKKKRMDQNLKRIAQMGLGGAKRPNMAVPMAQGGIVGFSGEDGSFVQEPYGTDRGKAIDYFRNNIMNDPKYTAKEKRAMMDNILRRSKHTVPVGQYSSMIPTGVAGLIAPGLETSAMDVIGDTNVINQALNLQDAVKSRTENVEVAPGIYEEKVIPGKQLTTAEQSIIDTGLGTTDATDIDKLKPSFKSVQLKEKEDIPFAGPTDPTDLFPQIKKIDKKEPEEKIKDIKDVEPGDTKKDLDEKNDEYNEWLERLLTVLSAPASGRGLGGGNRARAYLQYSQRIFDNRAKIREIEADELEAQAKIELNKLSRDELSYSRLVGRQTKLLEIIQDVRDKATENFKFKLIGLNATVSDMSKPESERAKAANEIQAINNLIKDAVEDATKKERALLKEVAVRLNMLGFDESAGSKKIS